MNQFGKLPVLAPMRLAIPFFLQTPDGNWIKSKISVRQPILRLPGEQIVGDVDIWVGTFSAEDRCKTRFAVRVSAS